MPTSVLCLNHRIVFTRSPCNTKLSPVCPKIFRRVLSPTSISSSVILKCNSGSSEERETSDGNLKDALTGMVDQRVEELLNKEENRALLDGLEKASLRVEMAKKELAEIEKQELEANQMRDYVNKLESRAFEVCVCMFLSPFTHRGMFLFARETKKIRKGQFSNFIICF